MWAIPRFEWNATETPGEGLKNEKLIANNIPLCTSLVGSLAGQLIWVDEKIYLGRLKIWVN